MNSLLIITAQALIEHSIGRPESDVAAACDAALHFLRTHGASPMQLRSFLQTVRRELRSGKYVLPATLSTPSGSAGASATAIASCVERTLDTRIELHERSDAALLGGALLAIGDERIDCSLRGTLQSLHHHLTA